MLRSTHPLHFLLMLLAGWINRLNDAVAEQNADERLDWWTREYHCKICQGEPNTTP
jgi:hypothetical protein